MEEDKGVYSCIAENIAGAQKIDFKVVGTRLGSTNQTIPWNDLIKWFSTYKQGVMIDGVGSIQDAIDFLALSKTKP